MKVAIVRLSAMGDIIHSAVILEYLYKVGIQVDWIADKRFASILDNSPYVNQIKALNLKKDLIDSIKEAISWDKYDLVIDFQGLLKSAILSKFISKKSIGCDGYHTKEKLALLFYNQKLKIRNHSIGRYKDMVNEIFNLNITDEMIANHNPYMFYNEEDFITKDYFKNDKKNIIFIIGASAEFKMLPKETWVKLANSLNENILIPYGNKYEKEIAEYIANNSNSKVLPKMNLNQLKATISNADLVIGNDTGPTYIAWANNIKNIIIYGPVEANKVYENKYTKFIKSTTNTNPIKIDRNDFSIRNIKSNLIIEKINELGI